MNVPTRRMIETLSAPAERPWAMDTIETAEAESYDPGSTLEAACENRRTQRASFMPDRRGAIDWPAVVEAVKGAAP